MQLRMLFCVSLLLVATVLGHQYRNNDGRYSNFKSFWGNSYGISTTNVSHGIPKVEELRKGWLGHYEYRPFFSRILFGIPPLFDEEIHQQRPAMNEDSSHEDQRENDGLTGFLDWKRVPFGPLKSMELEQEYPSDGINSDSQEFQEEIEPDDNNDGTEVQIQKGNDFTPIIINDFNSSTVAVNLDDENDDDDYIDEEKEKETEDERDNSDKVVLLDDDPATSPVELPTIPEKNSGEILSDTDDDDDDVPQPEVMPVGPALVPSQPTGDEFLPWHSPFDYFSHGGGRSPSAITHKQFNEVPDPVIFANQGPIYDFWNSAEEYSWFSDDLPELPLAIQSPDDEQSPTTSPVLTIISSTTTPEPEYKFRRTSDKPKSVYKHNYRKVPIDIKPKSS